MLVSQYQDFPCLDSLVAVRYTQVYDNCQCFWNYTRDQDGYVNISIREIPILTDSDYYQGAQ